ncbi:MAG: 4-vinyl reductase [Deltaproteobacteria bacterium]|nr:4-vinyl reductase [Deltaproteobacteria bacterium]
MIPSLNFDSDNNIFEFNGSFVSFHCHHYNCGLLKAIEEIPNINGHCIIKETAEEEFFQEFKQMLTGESKEISPVKALEKAEELYRFMGLGRLDLSKLTENGGIAYADSSYYVVSWLAKYGRREAPVCYFTCGYIAGILSAIFDAVLYTYEVKETRCMILRYDRCEFTVSKKTNGD